MERVSSSLALYHLTRPGNWPRIRCNGIDVKLDARKVGRVWLCELTEVSEIARHLMVRDGNKIAQFALIAISGHIRCDIKKCGRKGVYYVERTIPANLLSMCSIVHVDGMEDVLARCL